MGKKLEQQLHKLDPRLRMIANGDEIVNTLRAEQAPDVTVQTQELIDIPTVRNRRERILARDQLTAFERHKLQETPDDIAVNVFVQLKEDQESLPAILHEPELRGLRQRFIHAIRRQEQKMRHQAVRRGNQLAVQIPLGKLQDLLHDPGVISVERSEQIRFSPPINVETTFDSPGDVRRVPNAPAHQGKILVGIVDVGGFDFSHPDFLSGDGETRFMRIWDQGGDTRPAPAPFGYGSEITREQMNAALRAEDDPAFGIPAYELEPQSQMMVGSHGTHVASIAAGNQGVCPQAYLAGVLIHIPQGDRDRRRSFYDSTRIVHAVEYLYRLGDELSRQTSQPVPVSVNISLGTNGHAHDASSATSRWVDHALAAAGRSLCVAAGNAGQEAPAHPTDWGFVTGRIHTSGTLEAEGDRNELEWVVFGNSIIDLSENELEIWYSPRDHFAVQIKPPGGDWLEVLEPGEFIQNRELPDGTFLSIYNEMYKPANGLNYIGIYLSPLYAREGIVGVKAGTWRVRLIGRDVRDGDYHAWIERDDPQPLGDLGDREAWFFPSFFSQDTNVDNSSVSSLACGRSVISVANLDPAAGSIHITSSQGPTRDGREKPEIAAPGTGINAAKGFDPQQRWISMTGTSMASPYVAGVAGLMLAANPELTASQIGGILRRTARPLGEDFTWRDDSGFGRIDPQACLNEVVNLALKEVDLP